MLDIDRIISECVIKLSDDNIFLIEHKDLRYISWAESKETIRSVIIEELNFLWKEYAELPNEKLTKDAIRLKNALLNYVY